MTTKYNKMSDEELMRELNHAISIWSLAYTDEQFKSAIISEIRKIQVERLLNKWKKEAKA